MEKATLESIKQSLANGLSTKEMAKQYGLNEKTFYSQVSKFGGIAKLRLEVGVPQYKAHQTMKKNALIESYNTATSKGIKAGIARKFKNTFGSTIKAELSKVKAPKVVAPKVEKKIAFKEKEVQFMLPTKIKEMINELHDKINALELTIQNMKKK